MTGRLSELARNVFPGMEIHAVPPETIIYGNIADEEQLSELLALCRTLGLELVSFQRLPD
ncbi:MAG TPA: hypothetical protein VGH99_14595 [Pseudonocardia sp.]